MDHSTELAREASLPPVQDQPKKEPFIVNTLVITTSNLTMASRKKFRTSSLPTAPLKENNAISPSDVLEERPKPTRGFETASEEVLDGKEMSPNMKEMKQSACDIMHRSGVGSEQVFDRRFQAHFGASLIVATYVWELLMREMELPAEATMLRFLWSLMLMFNYDTEEVNCTKAAGIDEQTFREWAWFFVHQISYLEPFVIVWENRKRGDEGNHCLTSIDGTDCPYEAKGRKWWSYKFRKSGLRYLIALCIKTGDIVYIDGPFPPGKGGLNDLATFRWGIMGWLEENERVEADDGYLGEAPLHVKCPKSFSRIEKALAMQQGVRSRHENVNKRMKQWGCLRNRFRHHDFAKHSSCFRAVAVLTQIAMEHGEPLPDVEYSDAIVESLPEPNDDEEH